MRHFIKNIMGFQVYWKRLILINFDVITIAISFYLSDLITRRNPLEDLNNNEFNFLLLTSIIMGVFIYSATKKYNTILRFFISNIIYFHFIRNLLLVISISFIYYVINKTIPSLKLLFTFWFLINLINILTSKLISDILLSNANIAKTNKISNVAIFGAGKLGVELFSSLRSSKKYKVRYFLDDDKSIWYRNISGIYIYPLQKLEKDFDQIDQIHITVSNLKSKRKKEIFNLAKKYNIEILQIPSIEDLSKNVLKINSLKPISIEDLLCRDPIPPNEQLLKEAIEEKIILITGAGGSIGTELSKQVALNKPKKIIFLERSEFNLYCLEKEMNERFPKNINFHFILGDILDFKFLKNLVKDMRVNIIFHSAAYKHVPLIEKNQLMGIENNIIGTLNTCKAAQFESVKKLILISTDKAVRPCNVMGATKRVSELICMAFAEQEKIKKMNNPKYKIKMFSMVRFGNVLASSGSVVPLFKEKIEKRQPITITHPDIVRYFMTIEEAANLVIQASEMAKGSDLFLFDMGELISIRVLAEKMIAISGLTQKTKNNPDGDIEIIYTGLRPGEKLYEELLIDSNAFKTAHPRIFTAKESYISSEKLFPKLDLLKKALKYHNKNDALKLLKDLVREWKTESNFS